jgi:hypothetical protein
VAVYKPRQRLVVQVQLERRDDPREHQAVEQANSRAVRLFRL